MPRETGSNSRKAVQLHAREVLVNTAYLAVSNNVFRPRISRFISFITSQLSLSYLQLRYQRVLCISISDHCPHLRKFSANPLVNFFLDFSKFGLSIKSWPPTPSLPHPPSPDMGIWDFSKFGLSFKSWSSNRPPPTYSGHGNLGF